MRKRDAVPGRTLSSGKGILPTRGFLVMALVLAVAAGAAMLWARPTSATVPPLNDVATISAGYYHSCAVANDGGVKCWGENDDQQLGIPLADSPDMCDTTLEGLVECSLTPVDVCANAECTSLLTGIAEVAAGLTHTCALTTDGHVKCWGENNAGQLGDGTTDPRPVPVDVCASAACSSLLENVVAIGTGGGLQDTNQSCALTSGDKVKCWGSNNVGQLGDGTTTSRSTPVDVCADEECKDALTGAGSLSVGADHACVTVDTSAKCWGGNGRGQLGDGDGGFKIFNQWPVDVCATGATAPCDGSGEQLSGVGSIIANGATTCALIDASPAANYDMKCWGYNQFGQVGNGDSGTGSDVDVLIPVDVCATGAEPSLPETPCSKTNDPPDHLTDIESMAHGPISYHTCAVVGGGTGMKCWGNNNFGQIGDGTQVPVTTPFDIVGLGGDVTEAKTGGYSSCALLDSPSRVQCWGENEYGDLGDGTGGHLDDLSLSPVYVVALAIDNDQDGCTDKQELGLDETKGGRRDPKNFWDFYDTPNANNERDGIVNGLDIAAILLRYGSNDAGEGDFDRDSEPLSEPNPAVEPSNARANYHPAFDRIGGGVDPWDAGPASGTINSVDITLATWQFGHTCQ